MVSRDEPDMVSFNKISFLNRNLFDMVPKEEPGVDSLNKISFLNKKLFLDIIR